MSDWIKGNNILDLGCEESPECHDYIQSRINMKIIKMDRIGNPDIKTDFEKPIDFPDSSVDTIITGYVLEHLFHPFEFLNECHRILRNGGRIVMTVPNMSSLPYLLNEYKDYGIHIHGWNMPMLEYYLTKVGFRILFKKKINAWYCRNLLFRFLCWVIPNWKACIVMVGEKNS